MATNPRRYDHNKNLGHDDERRQNEGRFTTGSLRQCLAYKRKDRASNHPPAEPGAFKIVSRSKRLSWVADATALSLGPPKGGLLASEV